jgi:hypothetical protein
VGNCGFYPLDHRGKRCSGTAATFEAARADFEAAWQAYLPLCTEADFLDHRRQRAFTTWNYQMHDTGRPLPTQLSSGRSRCFCGASIDLQGVDKHVSGAYDELGASMKLTTERPFAEP